MRILYFHQHFTLPSGSGGVRSYQIAKELVAQGHEVVMICGHSLRSGLNNGDFDPSCSFRRTVVDGINIIELNLPYSNHDGFIKRSCTFLRYALRSVMIALKEPYDLVFATSTPLTAAIPGIAARWLRRKRFVFEVRDLWPELPREMGVIRNPIALWVLSTLEWIAYRSANGCIGLSPGIVEGIRRRSCKSLPVAMVPNGCDLELFQPGKHGNVELDGLKPEAFKAVFAGAHGIANGLHRVLDVATELKRRSRMDIQLVLIGDGKLKPDLQRRAEAEKLNNVVFLPPMPKLELAQKLGCFNAGMQILDNIPAFYYGTSPNKFFDYLSAGLPVVNNYPGWVADLIAEYACGIPVAAESAAAFADALERLADNTRLCEQMGANARKLAEVHFSRDKLVDEWIGFVIGISGKKSQY